MRFVHAADIHLDSLLLNLALTEETQIGRMQGASRSAFDRLVQLCIDRDAAFLLLSGDLFDHDKPNMQTVRYLRSQLLRLNDKGIRVAIIKGNHDALNRTSSGLEPPPKTHVFREGKPDTKLWDDLPVPIAIHGQSFSAGPVTENLAARYPAAVAGYLNIGLLHTSLVGNEDHDPYAPCTLAELVAHGYDYWALGHIHKGAVLHREPWVVYPGNLQGRHAKETGPKGCVLVEIENTRIAHVEPVALDTVRWEQVAIDLAGRVNWYELTDAVRHGLAEAYGNADGRPLAARVLLTGHTPLHGEIEIGPARLRHLVTELADEEGAGEIWIEKIRNDTSPADSVADERSTAIELPSELLPIVRELTSDPARLAGLLEEELGALRSRLPEELRRFSLLDELADPAQAGAAVSRLEARLAARLAGREDRGDS